MKKYKIIIDEGIGTVRAENEEDLHRKLNTGQYGILPIRSRNFIRFTPANIKKIIEIEEELSNP